MSEVDWEFRTVTEIGRDLAYWFRQSPEILDRTAEEFFAWTAGACGAGIRSEDARCWHGVEESEELDVLEDIRVVSNPALVIAPERLSDAEKVQMDAALEAGTSPVDFVRKILEQRRQDNSKRAR